MIKVVQYGLGYIGCDIVKLVLGRKELELVGAIDIDPKKVGRDVGDLVFTKKTGVKVSDNPEEVFSEKNIDVVLHSTSSFLKEVFPQLKYAITAGANVVSTTEELSYPYLKNPDIAREIDELSRKNNVTVLGTGVNPGFVMDTLAIVSTVVCQSIEKIRIKRVVDAGKRRYPLQKKVGAGLRIEEFEKLKREKRIGHVGLQESLAMICDAIGWNIDRVHERLEPVVASEIVESKFFNVQRGEVKGINQKATGYMKEVEMITLELQMYLGATSIDSIMIKGEPGIELEVKGGLFGDTATSAIVVNSIQNVLRAMPGLATMKDLPLPSARL